VIFNSHAIKALARLEGTPDFETVMQAIKSGLDEHHKVLIEASDPVMIHRSQGAAALLQELIGMARDAREIAKRQGL